MRKKLRLNTETLRKLTESQARNVYGGDSGYGTCGNSIVNCTAQSCPVDDCVRTYTCTRQGTDETCKYTQENFVTCDTCPEPSVSCWCG